MTLKFNTVLALASWQIWPRDSKQCVHEFTKRVILFSKAIIAPDAPLPLECTLCSSARNQHICPGAISENKNPAEPQDAVNPAAVIPALCALYERFHHVGPLKLVTELSVVIPCSNSWNRESIIRASATINCTHTNRRHRGVCRYWLTRVKQVQTCSAGPPMLTCAK